MTNGKIDHVTVRTGGAAAGKGTKALSSRFASSIFAGSDCDRAVEIGSGADDVEVRSTILEDELDVLIEVHRSAQHGHRCGERMNQCTCAGA